MEFGIQQLYAQKRRPMKSKKWPRRKRRREFCKTNELDFSKSTPLSGPKCCSARIIHRSEQKAKEERSVIRVLSADVPSGNRISESKKHAIGETLYALASSASPVESIACAAAPPRRQAGAQNPRAHQRSHLFVLSLACSSRKCQPRDGRSDSLCIVRRDVQMIADSGAFDRTIRIDCSRKAKVNQQSAKNESNQRDDAAFRSCGPSRQPSRTMD